MDWRDSKYIVSHEFLKEGSFNKVAESCCKSPSNLCAVRDHPSNINSNGCADLFENSVSGHLFLYGLLVLAVCFFQLCCLVINSVLVHRISQRKKYEFISNNTSEILKIGKIFFFGQIYLKVPAIQNV